MQNFHILFRIMKHVNSAKHRIANVNYCVLDNGIIYQAHWA